MRHIPIACAILVCLAGSLPCAAQEELLKGWTYTTDANPLGDEWADPGFTKLTDGDKSPNKSVILGRGAVTIDVKLPGVCRVEKVVAQVWRHNNNYKLRSVRVEALQAGQYVTVGENTNGFWGPTQETLFTLEVPAQVTTEALRLVFLPESIVSIQEVEIYGAPAGGDGDSEYLLPLDSSPGARASQADADADGQSEAVLENPYVRLVFEPEGGVCRSFVFKQTGSELVGGAAPYGLLRDQLWSPNYAFGDRFYFTQIGNEPGEAWVELKTRGIGGMMSFTEITKRITLRADSPVVRVHYTLTNDLNSQTDYEYGLWSHHFLGVRGQDATYFFPTERGVLEERFVAGQPIEPWHWDPARGWAAYVADNGVGLAATMDYKYLNCFYMWAGAGTPIPTFEWRYNQIPLKAGESLQTDITLIPFQGISRVDGVLGEVVAGLALDPGDDDQSRTIRLEMASSMPQADYDITIRTRALPDGEWEVANQPQVSSNAATVQVSFTWRFAPGAHAIRATLTFVDGGKELGFVERPLVIGDAPLKYTLRPLEERVGKTGPAETKTQPGHELSTEVETPHVAWAKPYCKGPIKALVLCDDRYSREVIELWQRLELDFEYVKFFTTYEKEYLYHGDRSILNLDAARRRLTEKLEQDYDVIILSGLKWDFHFTPEIRETIAEKIKAGTGLVYIEPDGLTTDDELEGVCGISDGEKRTLHSWGKWQQSADHYVISGLPWDALPRTRKMPYTTPPIGEVLATHESNASHPLIVAGSLGEGRVLSLGYDTLTHAPSYRGYAALTPAISYRGSYSLPDEMKLITWQYWEYWWALLARCAVWAADKDTGIEIGELQAGGDEQRLAGTITGDLPAGSVLQVIFRDRFSAPLTQTTVAADAAFALPLPANLRAGRQFADIVLRDSQGRALAWAATSFSGPEAPVIGRVSVEKRTLTSTVSLAPEGQPWKRVFRAAEPFRATCEVRTVLPVTEPPTVEARLSDCHGRLLFTEAKQVPPGMPTVTFEASPPVLYNMGHRWDFTLRAGERILDTDHVEVIAIAPRDMDRLSFTSWGGQHLWRCQYLFDYVRPLVEDLGLDVAMNGQTELGTGKVWWDYYQNIDHSFLGLLDYLGKDVPDFMDRDYAKKAAEYAKTKEKQWLVRDPSLKDPDYLAAMASGLKTTKLDLVQEFGGAYDFCMGDEMSLTHYTAYHDFDFGEHSLAAFRKWLQQRYPSLDALNAAWETGFADWDAVTPMTLDEVKGRANAAPWAEFRDYMNDSLADYYKLVQDTIRETYPGARCGLSGTQEPKPGNGMDWWQNSSAFSYYHSYNTGWSDEMRRSFQPYTGVMCTPYRCGYWQEGQGLEYQMFWCLLHDTKGISAWTTPLFFYGDFTFSEAGRDTRANIHELKAGLWDAIRTGTRRHDGIAIHYSHPSINAALLMNKDSHIVKVRDAWVKLIEDLGLQYNFVSYAQIEAGILTDDQDPFAGYKVLILPESIALSEKEVAQIRAFVERGGCVVGDQSIGLMDDKCRTQQKGLLDDLFGIERAGERAALQPGVEVEGVETPIGLPAAESNVRATTAIARGYVPDTEVPAVLVNKAEGGQACFLNIDLAEFDNERRFATETEKGIRKVLLDVLAQFGVRPAHPVTFASGKAPHVEVIRYQAGALEYLGLLNDASSSGDEVAQVPLGRPAHVYDMRAGAYLGRLDSLTVPLQPGDCRVYCLAAEALSPPTVTAAPGPERTAGITVALQQTQPGVRQLVRLALLRPDGSESADYSQNLIVGTQPVSAAVRFALNDPAGEWTVRVTPLCGGQAQAQTARIALE